MSLDAFRFSGVVPTWLFQLESSWLSSNFKSLENFPWHYGYSFCALRFCSCHRFPTFHTQFSSEFHPKQVCFPRDWPHDPQVWKWLWLPHYNPIHGPASAFTTCSILMWLCFSGTVTEAFPDFHKFVFKLQEWTLSWMPFIPSFFHLRCFQCPSMFSQLSVLHLFFLLWLIVCSTFTV